MFEVYADEQCTQRPIVGQSYDTLYLQVNAVLPMQCPSPEYTHDQDGVNYPVCPQEISPGDPVSITFAIDWFLDLFEYAEGDDLSLQKGVYKLENNLSVEITSNIKLSSGPVVARM